MSKKTIPCKTCLINPICKDSYKRSVKRNLELIKKIKENEKEVPKSRNKELVIKALRGFQDLVITNRTCDFSYVIDPRRERFHFNRY